MVDSAVTRVHVSPMPDRLALRRDLEATRRAVHRLLSRLSDDQWHEPSPGSAWTVGEVFVHLTWALEYSPAEVAKAKRGKGMFNLPRRVADPLSYWYIRWLARRLTPQTVLHRYEAAIAAAIRALDAVKDSDWALGADFYGEGFHTVADLFQVPARHLAEHTVGLELKWVPL